MWKCPKCKEESEDNFDSCSSCGTGRDGSPPTKFATCPHCGKDVAATDSACVHCGGTTKEDESIRPVYIMMNDVVGASLQKPAAPPPFYPPSGAPSCPQCASSEHLIKASAAYEQGTSAISGRGRQAGGAFYRAGDGGVGIAPIVTRTSFRGTQQTALAERLSPPVMPRISDGGMVMLAIGGGISVFTLMFMLSTDRRDDQWGVLVIFVFGIGLTGLGIWMRKSDMRSYKTGVMKYNQAYTQWMRLWYCTKCGGTCYF